MKNMMLDEFKKNWQDIVDSMASIVHIPAGLIMKITDDKIEVFVSSHTEGNPYKLGDSEILDNSGLYCETVIKSKKKLLVPNALKDDHWKTNPDIKLNMISYLGFPVLYPDQSVFGTICILDNKENAYSDLTEKLMLQLKKLIESNLAIVYMNQELGEEKLNLKDVIQEIKTLRGILPICSKCKKIRDDKGYWNQIEEYITDHSEVKFSHGLCPQCEREMYNSMGNDQNFT